MTPNLRQALKGALLDIKPGANIFIAFSGGLDSQVLLHLLTNWARDNAVLITALHVNHGLSVNADIWQDICTQRCQAYGLPILSKSLRLQAKTNIEHRARMERYAWFATQMSAGDVLLTGHHRDDQAETVLMRLMRSSGSRGLGAMSPSREFAKGYLIRPLLDIPRQALQDYANEFGLKWVNDESNHCIKYDRNYIRHKILPVLTERWPQAGKQLAQSAMHCRADHALLNDLATIDLSSSQSDQALSVLDVLPPFSLEAMGTLSRQRQCNVLQYVLREHLDFPLAYERLKEWLDQVESHSGDSKTQLRLQKMILRVHGDLMYFIKPIEKLSGKRLDWQPQYPLAIDALACQLQITKYATGIEPENVKDEIVVGENDHLTVHWRLGGERVKLPGEPFTRSMKKLLQAKQVPPWLRDDLPMVSVDEHIVWSAALGDFVPGLCDASSKKISFRLVRN